LSYETYALVRDLVRARPLDSIKMKGISREVVPYTVEGLLGDLAQRDQVISEHVTGLDLFLDLDAIDDDGVQRAKKRLSEALLALSVRGKPWPVTGGAGSEAG
jgi:adenylate cyclase